MIPTPAVRHRAGRAARRVPAGRPRRDGRERPRLTPWRRATPPSTGRPARCPSRGCATPRSTSSCWSTCGTRWRRSWTGRASWSGPAQEFDAIAVGAARRRRARTPGAVRPACTRCAGAGRWRSYGSCGRPGTGSRSGGTSRRARCSATRRSSRRRSRCRPNVQALAALPGFGHRMGRRQLEQWQAAVDRAKALPETELPQPGQPLTGPPPPRSWADKDPAAAARLSAARAAVTALAEELNMPQENLITPDTVRRLCWEPPRARTRGRRLGRRRCVASAAPRRVADRSRPRVAVADARTRVLSPTARCPSPGSRRPAGRKPAPRRGLGRGSPVGTGVDRGATPRTASSRLALLRRVPGTGSMVTCSGEPRQRCRAAVPSRTWRRANVPRTVRDVVFVDGVRTPFGKAGPKGIYHETRADDLVVKAIRELLRRNPDLDPENDRRGRHRRDHPDRRPGPDPRPHRRHPRRAAAVRARLLHRPHVRRRADRRHHHRRLHRLRCVRRRHRRRCRAHGPPPDGRGRRPEPAVRVARSWSTSPPCSWA